VRVAENGMQFIGVESGDETKKWIWSELLLFQRPVLRRSNVCFRNHHFAAVGGDAVAFESKDFYFLSF
jgi:hypothetical protein